MLTSRFHQAMKLHISGSIHQNKAQHEEPSALVRVRRTRDVLNCAMSMQATCIVSVPTHVTSRAISIPTCVGQRTRLEKPHDHVRQDEPIGSNDGPATKTPLMMTSQLLLISTQTSVNLLIVVHVALAFQAKNVTSSAATMQATLTALASAQVISKLRALDIHILAKINPISSYELLFFLVSSWKWR